MSSSVKKAVKRYPIRAAIIFAVLLLLYYLLFIFPLIYVDKHWVMLPPSWQIFLAALPLAGRMLCEYFPSDWTRRVSSIAMTWAGISFLLVCLIGFFNLLSLILPISDKQIIQISTVAVMFLSVAGVINAQRLHVNRFGITHRSIKQKRRVIQISDVHIGSRSSRFLSQVISEVNRLEPDLLLITGDLVDMDGMYEKELTALSNIQCPIYFCIGNHERYIHLDHILETLSWYGFRILRNESLVHDDLQLIGIDDAEHKKQVKQVLPNIAIDNDRYTILMYHRPDGFEFAAHLGVNLMLCGHTHNGQLIPFNWLVKRAFPKICGMYYEQQSQLYVSPGTGTWGPVMRIGSKNEITVFELSPK